MNTLQILQKAYTLLDDKRNWTQGKVAGDLNGERVSSGSGNAVCWCALGAIYRQDGGEEERDAVLALQTACSDLYHIDSISRVNDGPKGYRRIRTAFRRAMRSCE